MTDNTPALPHPAEPIEGFAPREPIVVVLRRWWWLVLIILAGGALGLLFEALRPAEYEAGFRITVGIDQTIAGELTQYEEDVMLEAVGGILYAPSQLEAVAQQASAEGISISAAELWDHSDVERRLATWRVRVRANSPAAAEKLAGIWFDLSQAELLRTYAQAAQADGLARYLDSLEACLARAVTSPPSYGACTQANLASVQAALQESGAAFTQARLSARGMSTSLVVDPAQMDRLPAQRVALLRGQMALAGGAIGFLVGMWLIQLDFSRWPRKGRRA